MTPPRHGDGGCGGDGRPPQGQRSAVAVAGALGNLSDRLLHRGVTDWLQVAWWPATFNLADIAIRGRIVVALVMSAPLRRAHQSRGRPFQVDARG